VMTTTVQDGGRFEPTACGICREPVNALAREIPERGTA